MKSGSILRGLLPLLLALPALAAEPAPELYRKHCSECHGADRFGLMGPALLPENLSRLRKPEAAAMIRDSRPAVQMPAFKDVLKPDEIQTLADYIYTPVPMPQWGERRSAPRASCTSRPARCPTSRSSPPT